MLDGEIAVPYVVPGVDRLEQAFYDAPTETNVLPRGAEMLGLALLAFWFTAVCLYLVIQQWSGELSGRDA
jgi:hypothetical protein